MMNNVDDLHLPFFPHRVVESSKRWHPCLERWGIGEGTVLAAQGRDPGVWLGCWALARSAGLPFMPLSPDLPSEAVDRLPMEGALLAPGGGGEMRLERRFGQQDLIGEAGSMGLGR